MAGVMAVGSQRQRASMRLAVLLASQTIGKEDAMKYTKQDFSVEIVGNVKGTIWMPAVECTKDIREIARDDDTLRDTVLRVTNDGDFQSCDIEDAAVKVTLIKPNRRAVRWFDIRSRLFPSVEDCLTKE